MTIRSSPNDNLITGPNQTIQYFAFWFFICSFLAVKAAILSFAFCVRICLLNSLTILSLSLGNLFSNVGADDDADILCVVDDDGSVDS